MKCYGWQRRRERQGDGETVERERKIGFGWRKERGGDEENNVGKKIDDHLLKVLIQLSSQGKERKGGREVKMQITLTETKYEEKT